MAVFSALFPSKLCVVLLQIISPKNNCAGGVLQLFYLSFT